MHPIFHVIKDPVHGTMQFTSTEDAWIKPFVDSQNFQRLRHIKQLGLGDYIFPGAVHSRFNHSVGCCYVGSQIAHKIGLADEERQLVMIACLLHDIGHGPFSHAFEGIFHQKLIQHEDWTPYFLSDYKQIDFFNTYNKRNPRHHLTEEKFKFIADMIMHQPVLKRVLADIVSSQLDADRLDYLLRDNHFCGVRYGEFDFRWMLHCMTIVGSNSGERLGITHKGIGVVEHYLMARRLMLRNIYHSQKKLALEFYLVEWLASLAASLEDDDHFASIRETRLGQFLISANQFNQRVKIKTNIQQEKLLFLSKNYSNYKELCDYDVFSIVRMISNFNYNHPAVHIAKRLQYRHMPKILRVNPVDLQKLETELQHFKAAHPSYASWQIALIQTPHRAYSGENDPILVVNEQGKIQTLDQLSIMISAISDQLEHIAFVCVDRHIAEEPPIKKLIDRLKANIV
ncbi:MAG: hypothetical protein A3F12_07380 [Gammaproteobacteria bacterium RIFCSPHIGHO2_12_FULL_38_14]|nr:MAG: hypothetical protein A3F12_07380 [Gammaproteobacteria bacterium RIFCSPHIGHO2_12_FULL_38_14]